MTRFSFRAAYGSIWMLAALLIAGLTPARPLRADDASSPDATARLSCAEGGVRLVQAGQVIADPAPVNAPVFEGAQLVTATDGKAEVQFADGSVARLSPNSALTLVKLSGQQGTEVQLSTGLAYFEVPAGGSRPMRIRFGDSMVTAATGSVLRIRMDTPPGELAVFAGNAHLERGGTLTVDLNADQSVALTTAADGYKLADQIAPDSWDAWNQDRDQVLNVEASRQSGAAFDVLGEATDNPAWNDLDSNGSWYNVPGQGYVWSPFAAANASWDPYGCGHWMWTPRWGYVWASCESWGFMPYMCGAWNYYDGFGWGWGPGLGMGCRGGLWGAGYFGGVHVGRVPAGYQTIGRPTPRRPVGGPPKPINVLRRNPGAGGALPPRNGLATIGGQPVRPIGRPTRPNYDRTSQSFDARTSPTRPGGEVHAPGMSYGMRSNQLAPGMTVHSSNGVSGNRTYSPGLRPSPPQQNSYQPQSHNFQSPAQHNSMSSGSHSFSSSSSSSFHGGGGFSGGSSGGGGGSHGGGGGSGGGGGGGSHK
jgi:hypothetical protein